MVESSTTIKVAFGIFAFANVVSALFLNWNKASFIGSLLKRVNLKMVLECLVAVTLVGISYFSLAAYVPALSFGWMHLFYENGGNMIVNPMYEASYSESLYIRLITPIFLLLLILAVPFMVHMEENIFRRGYHNWKSIIRQSLLFGFMHMTVGVSVSVGIILSAVGLFFACKYKKAYEQLGDELTETERQDEAVLHSTAYHTVYNYIVFGSSLLLILVSL